MLDDWRSTDVQSNKAALSRLEDIEQKLNDIESKLSDRRNTDLGYPEPQQTHNDPDEPAPLVSMDLSHLCQEISRLSGDLDELSRTYNVLRSLRFESMEVRHASINSAHKKTFEWIFQTEDLQQNDPRSAITYASWLQNGDGVYWITGKPGSGKSTLMKYLEDNPQTQLGLQQWSKDTRLVMASFYFWNSGTEMQKSLTGLLQSLLYHILDTCPDLIPILCPKRWEYKRKSSIPWSLEELHQSFDILNRQNGISTKFYFHVDGLDEYHGDHFAVIEILQKISKSRNVKLCVSSRPWNCFEDAYGQSEELTLQLHELTRNDMKIFAEDSIRIHLTQGKHTPEMQHCGDLVEEIVQRAQGVFLWVRLVVRSLRQGLVNNDPVSLLQKRLRALPTDLEPFFEHILNSVEDIYQERMATTFLTAITHDQPLKIIHYAILDEEDPEFALQYPFTKWKDKELYSRVYQTKRRLNGRYKGLLESCEEEGQPPHQGAVHFLHRTLRDFLVTPRMQSMLFARSPSNFDPHRAIGYAFLAEAKFVWLGETLQPFCQTVFEYVLAYSNDIGEKTGNFGLEYTILDHIELLFKNGCCKWPSYITESGNNCMIQTALHIGRTDYVRYRLSLETSAQDREYCLMHAIRSERRSTLNFKNTIGSAEILFTSICTTVDVHLLSLIRHLLETGTSPNGSVNGVSIWRSFIELFLSRTNVVLDKYLHKMFSLLLLHGANVNDHSDLWGKLFTHGGYSDIFYDHSDYVLSLFRALFTHGLDPNARFLDTSLWKSLLHRVSSHSYPLKYYIPTLKEFLRHGADLRHTYENDRSWFACRLDHITSGVITESPHTWDEFELMLQHGLDPNSQVRGQTLWDHILQAIQNSSIRSMPSGHSRMTFPTSIILFLRYGANPFSEVLLDLMQWARTTSSIFTSDQFEELQDLLQREQANFKSRESSSVRNSKSHPYCHTEEAKNGGEKDAEGRQRKPLPTYQQHQGHRMHNSSDSYFRAKQFKRRRDHEFRNPTNCSKNAYYDCQRRTRRRLE